MNELELELQQMMTDRAGAVRAIPDVRNAVRRARVRRVANAGAATLAVVALATVSSIAVRELVTPEASKVQVAQPGETTTGEYGFTSVEGEYPTVASGTFRGAEWELTATAIDGDSVDLSLTLDGLATQSTQLEATDDQVLLAHMEASDQLAGADVVFGATIPGVAAIDISVADGEDTRVSAHRYLAYDSQSSLQVDYFVAFVPGEAPGGVVHARDHLGVDLETEVYGDISMAPHVVASGVAGETEWNIEFAAMQKDRFCIVFAAGDIGSECVTREELEAAGPLHLIKFERDDVLGLVAIISGDVNQTFLNVDGDDPATLRWFQPPQEDLGEWPLRMVAIALEPGAHGSIEATFGEPQTSVEEPF